MSQILKRKLEDRLDRPMSDSTWYRVLKNLKEIGIKENEYDSAFELIASINSGKRSKRSKIAKIPYGFQDVWTVIQRFSNRFDEYKKMNCEEFRSYLENSMEIKPKVRVKDGRVIGFNTIWYTWFERGGVPYDRNESHSISKYMAVAAQAYSWEYRKKIITVSQLKQEIGV